MRTHLLIVDKEKTILRNILLEILKKDKKIFAFLNKESLFIELSKFCEENNIKKYSQSEKFCFSIEYRSEIMIYILNCLIVDKFKPLTQIFVENYFEKWKNIKNNERVYFSISFVDDIINYINLHSAKDPIEFSYFSELINGLKKLKLSLSDNYNGDFDISNRMKNKENTILFSNEDYMKKIIHILNKNDNIEELNSSKNNNLDQYFISLPDVSEINDIVSISFAQCRSLKKSMLIYTDFMDASFYKTSLNCNTKAIRLFYDKNNFLVNECGKTSVLNFS